MDGPRAAGSETPVAIHADREARSLAIEWADGHRTAYDFVALRWLCPCAYCRGEAGMPGWLDGAPTLTPEQTRMTDIRLVGQYAVAPTWGDGHETGFYTYRLLRDRCPCAECAARRGVPGGDGLRAVGRVDAPGPSTAGHAGHAGHAPGRAGA